MAKSRSRLFADLVKTFYSGTTEEKSVEKKKVTRTNTDDASLDTVSTSAASAVTFFVNATRNNSNHFTILSAVKKSSTEADYNEFGTIITDSSLATFSVDINSGNFRLRVKPTLSNVDFSITRILVETNNTNI